DDGRAPCLLHIRTSGEQRDDVIPSREHGTLEEDVAVGVEAGEVIVAFLRKEEQRIEPALDEQTPCLRQALCVLLTAKMEVGLHHACPPQRGGPATASPLSARPRGQDQVLYGLGSSQGAPQWPRFRFSDWGPRVRPLAPGCWQADGCQSIAPAPDGWQRRPRWRCR